MGGQATVRSKGCAVSFDLEADLWRRLREALEGADLAALAGDYPLPAGAADLITEEIVAGRDVVRIGDFASLPARVRRGLEPLVGTLGEILAQGKYRQGAACE